jgi:hypothetical protein
MPTKGEKKKLIDVKTERAICEYAEKNPSFNNAEIAVVFDLSDRSTVTRILARRRS